VCFVGYLYIMNLINAQKKEHTKKSAHQVLLPKAITIYICTESSDTDNVYQYSKYFEVGINKFNKIYLKLQLAIE